MVVVVVVAVPGDDDDDDDVAAVSVAMAAAGRASLLGGTTGTDTGRDDIRLAAGWIYGVSVVVVVVCVVSFSSCICL